MSKAAPHPHCLYRRHELRFVPMEGGPQWQRVPLDVWRVLCLATHYTTGQELVVCRCVETGLCIVGSLSWFAQRMEPVEVEKPPEKAFDATSKGPDY